jgi:hypothetical protein
LGQENSLIDLHLAVSAWPVIVSAAGCLFAGHNLFVCSLVSLFCPAPANACIKDKELSSPIPDDVYTSVHCSDDFSAHKRLHCGLAQ